jgi:hypothetical protein
MRYIPVTYYRWSKINSVYDDELFNSTSWEIFGRYTGLKWYKILYFPLSFVEQINKREDGNEWGVYNLPETFAVFPYIRFKPHELDFVVFKFMDNNDDILYRVTNIETIYKDDRSNLNFFRVKLTATGYKVNDVTPHLLDIYAYDEVTDNIYTLDDYSNIITSYQYIKQTLPEINRVIPSINMREL